MGKYAELYHYSADKEKIIVDSVALTNGKADFYGQLEGLPELYNISVSDAKRHISFFLENGDISLAGHIDSLTYIKANGTELNSRYNAHLERQGDIQDQMRPLYSAFNEAEQKGDSLSMKKIDSTYYALSDQLSALNKQFIIDNNTNILGPFYTLRVYYSDNDYPIVDSLDNTFDPLLADSKYIKELTRILGVWKDLQVGMHAPDFMQNDSTGNPLKLSNFQGKYLLVDFWASWCGPCRAENPNIVAAYNEFKDKGFTILGVSLDENRAKWIKAIEKDNLTWNHVSDLKGWDNEVSTAYGIRAIPYSILLDPDGVIIGKNLRGEELRKKLSETLL